MNQEPLTLPELYKGEFGLPELDTLVRDIEKCAEGAVVTVRSGSEMAGPAGAVTLSEVLDRARRGAVTGFQVRYQYAGDRWIDTLRQRGKERWNLIRIRHEGLSDEGAPQ